MLKNQISRDAGKNRPTRVLAASLIATFLFATYLRLSYITYGLPYLYNGDEMINFRIIQSMLARRSLDPEFFNYPSLLFYLNLPGQVLFRNISGELVPIVSQSMGNGYAPQPAALLVARLVTVAFGVATVAASWRMARNVGLRLPFVLLAAIMVSSTPLLVRQSSFVTPDMIASFFTTATLAAAVSITRRTDWRIYVLAGILAGLAAATKYNAGLVGLAIPVAHFAGQRLQRAAPLIALAAASAIVALFAASPYLALNSTRAIDGFLFELQHYRNGHPGAEGDSFRTNARWLFNQTGWTFLFLSGLAFASARWRALAPVAFFTFTYFFLLSAQFVRFERNLLPMLPAFFVLLAAGAQQVAKMLPLRSLNPVIVGLFLAAAIAGPIGKSVRDLGDYDRDPRAHVRQWLEAQTSHAKKIAVDAYSPFLMVDPGTQVIGKYSVLSLPLKDLLGMDHVVLRMANVRRVLDAGDAPQIEVLKELSGRACETAEYPAPPARPQWKVFKLNCP